MQSINEAASAFLANKRVAVTGVSRAAKGHGKLTVGIRPEHLSVGGDGELTLEVALVEDLGSDSYIYGRLAGHPDSHVIVRATRDHPRPGETVKVKVDTAHLHLFDAETGRRVEVDGAGARQLEPNVDQASGLAS